MKKSWMILLVLASLSRLFSIAEASDKRGLGDYEVTIWQLSKHLDSPPDGRTFIEKNPGLGIRVYMSNKKSWEIFADANYISKNSTGGVASLVGVGGQRPILQTKHTDLLIGGVLGVARYENKWKDRTSVFPGAYPYLGLRYKDVSLIMGYIPHASIKGKPIHEILFIYVGVKI